jgi:hypothetical protein
VTVAAVSNRHARHKATMINGWDIQLAMIPMVIAK